VVDDLIFLTNEVLKINVVVINLCNLGVDLEQEDIAAGFLGVT
jgi:hypothetical protein